MLYVEVPNCDLVLKYDPAINLISFPLPNNSLTAKLEPDTRLRLLPGSKTTFIICTVELSNRKKLVAAEGELLKGTAVTVTVDVSAIKFEGENVALGFVNTIWLPVPSILIVPENQFPLLTKFPQISNRNFQEGLAANGFTSPSF